MHMPCLFLGVGLGRLTGMLSMVASTIFMSLRLAPSTATPTGIPSPSTSRLRLTPCLARSVGLFPVFFPPEGSFGHAAIHAQPRPVEALEFIVGLQAGLPHRQKDAGLEPFLEAVVCRGARTKAGGIERLPLATGAEHKHNGFHAHAVRRSRSASTKAMLVFVFGKQNL